MAVVYVGTTANLPGWNPSDSFEGMTTVRYTSFGGSTADATGWDLSVAGSDFVVTVPVRALEENAFGPNGLWPDQFGCDNSITFVVQYNYNTGLEAGVLVHATIGSPAPDIDNAGTYIDDGEIQFSWSSPADSVTGFALYDYDWFEADPFPSSVPPFWTGTAESYTHTDPDFSEDINYTLRATFDDGDETAYAFCNVFVEGGEEEPPPTYVFASVVGMPVRHPSKRQGGYTHTQGAASATWTIHHNLGHPPAALRVKDGSGNTLNPEVDDTSNNTTVLTFDDAYSGTAVLT
jgi:hypothetical protein